jgi:predicted nucleotidyltransferase
MNTLADVFRELNDLKTTGLVRNYAIGGATAALFYAEPARTYDVDVFVLLPTKVSTLLVSLEPLYDWAQRRGFGVAAEHILIHGVPVQFRPAHNALAQAGVTSARTVDYDGVPVRVIDLEHLVALAFEAGGPKRRERAWQLLEAGSVNRKRLRTLLAEHGIKMEIEDGP